MKSTLFSIALFTASIQANATALYGCTGEAGKLTLELSGNQIISVQSESGSKQKWTTPAFPDKSGAFYNFFYMAATQRDRSDDGYTTYTIFFRDSAVVKAEADWTSNDHDGQAALPDPVCTKIR